MTWFTLMETTDPCCTKCQHGKGVVELSCARVEWFARSLTGCGVHRIIRGLHIRSRWSDRLRDMGLLPGWGSGLRARRGERRCLPWHLGPQLLCASRAHGHSVVALYNRGIYRELTRSSKWNYLRRLGRWDCLCICAAPRFPTNVALQTT